MAFIVRYSGNVCEKSLQKDTEAIEVRMSRFDLGAG